MKKMTIVHCISVLCATLFFANPGFSAEVATSEQNLDEGMLAIQGYDPTSYHSDNVTKGSPQIQLNHDGVIYFFSSEDNRAAFEANPDPFIPAYGGWCAWAMLDGEKVRINPKSYKIIGGKTYLFYDFYFTDTLKKWNRLAKEQTEERLLEKADSAWNTLTSQ